MGAALTAGQRQYKKFASSLLKGDMLVVLFSGGTTYKFKVSREGFKEAQQIIINQ